MLEANEAATGEVEEVLESKSMDDTIRETLRSLQEQGIEPDAAIDEPPESPEAKADRLRDEQGKFKAATLAETEPPVVQESPVRAAPNTWKKEVAEKWGALPPEVQAEVERREADFHRGIEQYKQKAQFAEVMERTFAPFAATLQSLNISPDRAVSELLAADHRLRYGAPHEKAAYFAQLAGAYGIDLNSVVQPDQQPIDPNVSALQQQLQQLQGWVQQKSQLEQQQEQHALNSEIAAFAADPNHSHFESVRGHMAALLQAGQAKNLADAYEQAVYANPATRAAMLQQQAAKEREEQAKKAQAAKAAASVNVRARPSMPVSTPIGTMDDTIRATLRRLQAG